MTHGAASAELSSPISTDQLSPVSSKAAAMAELQSFALNFCATASVLMASEQSAFPDIDFSLSEFEEAGLLCEAES